MRKKILILFLAIVSAVCLCIGISACNGDSSVNGTYYEYTNNSYDYSSYIILKNGEWSDDSGASGTYEVSGTTIVFYTVLFGENDELMDGTVSDGVLTYYIGSYSFTYCKEGKSPSGDVASDSSGGSSGSSSGGGSTSSQYTVTYDANGGVFADDEETYTQTVSADSTLTAPTSPTREGYSFAGWATSKNGSTMWSFSSDKVTADITLYASWTEKSAAILSVDNAAIDGTDILLVVDRYTDSVSLSSIVVCSSDSSWKLYYDKLGQTEIPTKIAASLSGSLNSGDNVFYIVVTSTDGTQVNLYTLTVHRSYAVTVSYYNGSTLLDTVTAYTGYTFEADYIPSITGYTFNYWKTTSSGSTKYTAATIWGNLLLYASNTANTYTVTYDVNGGDELAETTATVTYDKSYTLTVPTRTNYTFEGWYSGSYQLTGSNGKSISNWNYASDKTLTAKWSGDSYIVTLNRSDNSAGTVTGSGVYSYTKSVTIKASTNNGYNWVGWYDADNELVTTETSYTFTMPADNVTYTAKWTYYTLTTAANDSDAGSVTDYVETKITTGKSVTITATSNSGYTWVGWYDGDTKLTSEFSYTFEMPAENLNYTAKWIETTVTVTSSDTSIGTVSGLTTTNNVLGNSVTVTATEVKLGYNWLGWYNGETKLSDEYSYTFTISETKTHYIAKYELDPAMSNFTFTSTTTTCSITGISDKTVTEIVVPDYVTSISGGAFSGCSSLESITLPFVGSSASATSASSSTLFGHIFGTSSYSGGTSTEQNYASSSYKTYYIPTTLTTVTIIGGNILYGAFYNCTALESITIPNSVTSIGNSAFFNCTALTSVYYSGTASQWASISFGNDPSNPLQYAGNLYLNGTLATDIMIEEITTVNAKAFLCCTSLTSVTIGSNVTSIGDYAFWGCTSLTSVTIGSNVTSIGTDAFLNCYKLVEVYNLSSITITAGSKGDDRVGYYAKNVYTSESGSTHLITQDGYVFYNDDSTYYLMGYTGSDTALTLPMFTINGTTVSYSIYQYAFYYKTEITSITIPDSVTSIGSFAFGGCSSLVSITLPFVGGSTKTSSDTYQYPFGYIFGTSSYTGGTATKQYYYGSSTSSSTYTTYYIPTTLTTVTITGGNILFGAFDGCSNLTSITIPDGVTSIGDYAFRYCTALTSVYYNGTASQWASISFGNSYANPLYYAGNLYLNGTLATEITIEGITTINADAFHNCTSLTSVTIGSDVTSIGDRAFYNCTSLTSVTIGSDVTSIGSSAFSDCYKLVVVYNLSSLEITAGNSSYGYVGYYAINVYTSESSSSYLTTQDGYIFYNDNDSYYLMGYTGSETELTLPALTVNGETVSYSVYQYAFYKNTKITSITMPDSITSIGSSAFSECTSLTSITIPDSVTSIGNYTFSECTSLTSITIPDGVTSIGGHAFDGCTSLTSITIPDGVTSIGQYAFYNCTSLTSVTFSNTSGWYRTATIFGVTSETTVSSTTVANASTMATYLTSTYSGWHWYRSES